MTAESGSAGQCMADWLALHGLGAEQMRRLVAPCTGWAEVRSPSRDEADPDSAHYLSPAAAWQLCAEALAARFGSGLTPAISQVHARTRLVLARLPKGGPRALTLPAEGDAPPQIICPFEGQARDMMTMAHEMGHALQSVASAGRPMPPVLREICAFAAEEALMAHLSATGATLLAPLEAALRRETRRIMKHPLTALLDALDHPEASYDYAWNYPPAKAVRPGQIAPETVAELFQGTLTLPSILQLSSSSPYWP